VEAYSQRRAVEDIVAVMDAAGIDRAHVVGLSMGGFAVLHFGLDHAERARSIVVAGAGYGAEKQFEGYFREVSNEVARQFETRGSETFAKTYSLGASRVQLQNKDPRGWQEFATSLVSIGGRRTTRCVRGGGPRSTTGRQPEEDAAPTLVMVGDEDDHCRSGTS
jgi:pimeloyl-ACP methyl ester carboxylesterase